jgi:hypothetical protein
MPIRTKEEALVTCRRILDAVEGMFEAQGVRLHRCRRLRWLQTRRVVEIVTHKVEYVDDLAVVPERRLQIRRDFLALLESTLRFGQRSGEIVHVPSAKKMAIGLHALLDELIQNWMLDPSALDLLAVGRAAEDARLTGLTAHRSEACAAQAVGTWLLGCNSWPVEMTRHVEYCVPCKRTGVGRRCTDADHCCSRNMRESRHG